MNAKQFSTTREDGTVRNHHYVTSDYHCIHCGKRDGCWYDTLGDDEYAGMRHVCTNCENSFHVPGYGGAVVTEDSKLALAELKKEE